MSVGDGPQTGDEKAVERDAAFVPAGCAMEPLPGTRTEENQSASGNDGSGQLRAALGDALAREEDAAMVAQALRCADSGHAGHWPTAAGILADEVRRLRAELDERPQVVEDDTTVERVARAIHAVSLGGLSDADAIAAWDDVRDGYTRNVALAKARAAVRALRGGAE